MAYPAVNYEPLFTIRETADIFKLSPAAVRQLIRKGEIPAIKIGKQFRVPQSVVDGYFASVKKIPGFGLLKGTKVPRGVAFENQMRRGRGVKRQTLDQLLKELARM